MQPYGSDAYVIPRGGGPHPGERTPAPAHSSGFPHTLDRGRYLHGGRGRRGGGMRPLPCLFAFRNTPLRIPNARWQRALPTVPGGVVHDPGSQFLIRSKPPSFSDSGSDLCLSHLPISLQPRLQPYGSDAYVIPQKRLPTVPGCGGDEKFEYGCNNFISGSGDNMETLPVRK